MFNDGIAFFGFAPTGASPIAERWRYQTDVQQALAGDETRHALVEEPRVTLEFDVHEPDFAHILDGLITGHQAALYLVPVWQDRAVLGASMASGQGTITVNTTDRAYTEGGQAAIWTDPITFEIVNITAVAGGSITVVPDTVLPWPATAQIAPVWTARLQTEATGTRFTGRALAARVLFEVEYPVAVAPLEWGTGSGGPWTADGYALFARTVNWEDDPATTYARRIWSMGDDTGPYWQADPSGRAWLKRAHLHTAATRDEIVKLKRWFAARRGRQKAYLAPVWEHGLEITRANGSGDTDIYIRNRLYTEMFARIPGRNYLAVRNSGGWIVRKILAITEFDEEEEIITLASSLGVAGTVAGWLNTLFAERVRSATDALELRYFSDSVADAVITHEQVLA